MQLFGAIDSPASFVIRNETLRVSGWALATDDEVQTVEILLNGEKIGSAEYGRLRPDIELHHGNNPHSRRSGFRLITPVTIGEFGNTIVIGAKVKLNSSEVDLLTRTVGIFDSFEEAVASFRLDKSRDWRLWLEFSSEFRIRGDDQGALTLLKAANRLWPANARVALHYAELATKYNSYAAAKSALTRCRDGSSSHDKKSIETKLQQIAYAVQVESLEHSPSEQSGTAGVISSNVVEDRSAVLAAFESIGFNCEFGLAQRHYGAEPLGLLRFGYSPLDLLLKALHDRFEGVGSPENTTLRQVWGTEYGVGDRRYNFLTHTEHHFIEGIDETSIYLKQCRRMRFLARKLIEDLKESKKVFLYQRYLRLSDLDIIQLADALDQYGENRLLCVRLSENGHAAGSVHWLRPRVMVGYISTFSRPENVADNMVPAAWLPVCMSAISLFNSIAPVQFPADRSR